MHGEQMILQNSGRARFVERLIGRLNEQISTNHVVEVSGVSNSFVDHLR